ncbi:hypothetical protein JW964_11870, partial [candidate division KSB1 bacterium]|nr:hypothetical protein [candidate division KSB1 bacterium]
QKFDKLNKVEQEQLNFLNIEFKEELAGLIEHLTPYQARIHRIRQNKYVKKVLPKIIYQNDRNFLSWSEDQFQIFVDPILNHHQKYSNTDSSDITEKAFQSTNGIRLRGNIADHLGFFIDVRDNKEWGTRKYKIGNYTLPRLGFVRATSPDYIYHDETLAYLKLGFKFIQITYGKFSNYWGSGRTGSLILSDYATSYDQLKLEFIFNKFKFTSLYADLIDYEEHDQDILQKKKYLSAHRLEFLPWKWLSLGLSETVIFKGRSFEPAYLNPVMFFRSAEHYLGSPDNMMMGLDFKCTALKNFKFYGELLIDDITTTKLGTDWYGNKLGYSAGAFWVDPFKIQNTDVRIEYTRIRPFVYSHENSLSYKHYDSLLGHRIGPNSDDLYFEINYRFSKFAKLTLFSEFWRHGENLANKNVGGDIDLPHRFGDDLEVNFLTGNLEKKNSHGVNFSYELFEGCYFQSGYKFFEAKNVIIQKENRGNNKGHCFSFSLGINY